MEALLIVLGAVVLAIPVSIVVLIVAQSRLRGRVDRLEAQLRAMGRPSVRIGAATPEPEPEPAPEEGPEAEPEPEAATPREPLPWERKRPEAADAAEPSEPPAAAAAAAEVADGPIVMRAEKAEALGRWLKENWVYAVSAVSLALAGVFLVQYGIEQGYLTPVMRVLMALGFGAALVVAGEVLRRRRDGGAWAAAAQLPATFAGAGIVSMFAGILAARQLYGLIGPEAALAGLVLVAGIAIILGWFHGAFLAAFGLLGAALSPFIVGGASETPYWMYIYFGVLAFTGLAVDAVRRWAWVSVLALALGFLGAFAVWSQVGGGGWYALTLVALALLAIAVPVLRLVPAHAGAMALETLVGQARGDKAVAWPEFPARLAAGAVLAGVAGLMLLPAEDAAESLLALLGLAALTLALTVWADRARALADLTLLPAAGFLVRLLAEGATFGPLARDYANAAIAFRPPETSAPVMGSLLLGLGVLITLAAAWRSFTDRDYPAAWAAGAALVAPVAAVILELFWAPGAVMGTYPWALHVIALAALMVVLAERFARADGEDHRRMAYATLSALSLIALALFLVTTKGALTLALAALVAVAAALDRRFRLPEMALFLQAGVVTLGWRLVVDPGLDWAIEAPLWEVWASFGGAIAALVAALWLLRPLDRHAARVFLESGLAGFAALFANVLITRWIEAEHGLFHMFTHWALTLQAVPWMVVMLVQFDRLRLGGRMRVPRWVIGSVAAVFALFPLLAALIPANPLMSSDRVEGWYLLDTLAVAYALPAILFLAPLGRLAHLPRWLRRLFIVLGAGLAVLYAALEIRRFWRGDILSVPGTTQAELYSYTVAMMLTGAALLYQAIARRSGGLRRVAMTVIALTIAKVFLIDMSGLTGLTRVFSFLLLGLSLAGLAWLNRWAALQQGGGEGGKVRGKNGGKDSGKGGGADGGAD